MEEQKKIHQIITISWQWFKPYILAPMNTNEEWEKFAADIDALIKGYKGGENDKRLFEDIVFALQDYLTRRHREIG